MNRIGISALCVGKRPMDIIFQNISILRSPRNNVINQMVQRDRGCMMKSTSIWSEPCHRCYGKESRYKQQDSTIGIVADKSTKKYNLHEKPIHLTSDQIKTLFYNKVVEPIALISQDKYYGFLNKPSANLKNNSDQNLKISLDSTESETFLEIPNSPIENSVDMPTNSEDKRLMNQPKFIDSILEKELGVDTKKYQDDEGKEEQAAKKSWTTIKYIFFIIGTSIIGVIMGGVMYIGAPKTDGDDVIDDKYCNMPIPLQYIYRTVDEFHNFNKLIKEPSREKLLPDILKPPYYQPPYTLVLEFTDILVHPEWTYSTGWRFKKRPGLDQFLETLYGRYEVVVYTAEMGMTVFPIIEALDKNNLISYKLVRDATKFMDGHHVKDLDKLNRELSKVIVIDWNPKSTELHEENLFRISRWKGNDDDTALYDLTALLVAISEWKVEDVRAVLKYYSEFDDPLASFKERQKMLAAQGL